MDYVTKDDLRIALEPFATRDEMQAEFREIRTALAECPTRDEMRMEIRADIREALSAYPTRDEMRGAIREEGERTRRHMDAVTERDRDDTRLLAEGYVALNQKIDKIRPGLDAEIAALARRVTRLELRRE